MKVVKFLINYINILWLSNGRKIMLLYNYFIILIDIAILIYSNEHSTLKNMRL